MEIKILNLTLTTQKLNTYKKYWIDLVFANLPTAQPLMLECDIFVFWMDLIQQHRQTGIFFDVLCHVYCKSAPKEFARISIWMVNLVKNGF